MEVDKLREEYIKKGMDPEKAEAKAFAKLLETREVPEPPKPKAKTPKK